MLTDSNVLHPSSAFKGSEMSRNTKQTSSQVATLAAEVLQDAQASEIAKRLAGSALSQSGNGRQSGAELEDLASRVLRSERYSDVTKELAASVLSQSNKER
jgi:hypothetical protein